MNIKVKVKVKGVRNNLQCVNKTLRDSPSKKTEDTIQRSLVLYEL